MRILSCRTWEKKAFDAVYQRKRCVTCYLMGDKKADNLGSYRLLMRSGGGLRRQLLCGFLDQRQQQLDVFQRDDRVQQRHLQAGHAIGLGHADVGAA